MRATAANSIRCKRNQWLGGIPLPFIGILILLSLLRLSPALATDNEVCMDCHADTELVRETEYKEGTTVFVDPELVEASVHEGMDCIECHADADDGHAEQLSAPACADLRRADMLSSTSMSDMSTDTISKHVPLSRPRARMCSDMSSGFSRISR